LQSKTQNRRLQSSADAAITRNSCQKLLCPLPARAKYNKDISVDNTAEDD
jgi:hypothetical protein